MVSVGVASLCVCVCVCAHTRGTNGIHDMVSMMLKVLCSLVPESLGTRLGFDIMSITEVIAGITCSTIKAYLFLNSEGFSWDKLL